MDTNKKKKWSEIDYAKAITAMLSEVAIKNKMQVGKVAPKNFSMKSVYKKFRYWFHRNFGKVYHSWEEVYEARKKELGG